MKNLLLLRAAGFAMLLLHLCPNSSNAQCFKRNGKLYNLNGSRCTNTVLSAVPFLRIVSDARSGALGDAGIALSSDANAMHFNASKLVFSEEDMAFSATYTPWLRSLGLNDVYLAYLTGFKKIDDLQAIGIGLRYFSLGRIPFTDINGQALNTGRPNELELSVAYSRKLGDNFSAAVTGKLIYSNLAAGQQLPGGGELITAATAGAADVSFTYQTPLKFQDLESDLRIGLAFSNIGSKITYTEAITKDYLPANLGLGVAWETQFDDYNTLTLTADINKLMVPSPCPTTPAECDQNNNGISDYKEYASVEGIFRSFGDAPEGFNEELRELMFSFGVEYWYDQQFALRAGYFTEHQTKGGRQYLTTGFGLKYTVFGMNFSYLVPTTNQRNPLDNTLRFSLLFDFNRELLRS